MHKRNFLPRSLSLSLVLIGLAVIAALVTSRPSLSAQDAPEKPAEKPADAPAPKPASFENANVETVLKWASEEIAAGFLYSPDKLTGDNAPTITYRAATTTTIDEKRILLYESLREVGLVPMPMRGMGSEVYRVVPIAEAAQLSNVSEHLEDLDGYYFGTLAFRARVMPFETLETIIAKHASKGAITIVVKESATIILSDFVDALHTIADAVTSADRRTPREDDAISYVFPVEKHSAESLTRLVSQARLPEEQYHAVHQRGTRVILLTGTRRDVEAATHRLELLEAADEIDEIAMELRALTTLVISADDLYRSLQTFFAAEVAAQQMRFASIPQRDQVLVSSSLADWKRAQAIFHEFDRLPQNSEEERNSKRVEERRAFDDPRGKREDTSKQTPDKPAEGEPKKDPAKPAD